LVGIAAELFFDLGSVRLYCHSLTVWYWFGTTKSIPTLLIRYMVRYVCLYLGTRFGPTVPLVRRERPYLVHGGLYIASRVNHSAYFSRVASRLSSGGWHNSGRDREYGRRSHYSSHPVVSSLSIIYLLAPCFPLGTEYSTY